jgi:hypothetical protein
LVQNDQVSGVLLLHVCVDGHNLGIKV